VYEEDLPDYFLARDAYLRAIGTVETNLLAPIINPGLVGGPVWPALRESWRCVRHGRNTILVSDGLSDPFDDNVEENVGLGVDVLVETAEEVGEPPAATWLFDLVYGVSQQAASSGAFRELRDDLGLFSSEIHAPVSLRRLASPEGHVGVLLGVPAPELIVEWELPAGLVRLVPATLLHPSELLHIREEGVAGRDRVSELLLASGSGHLSLINRSPVL